ncbi:histidine kinase [Aestuariivivens sediminicola]|uniref:histidine kinase n=1 Tax=Aestuariivivens sediminicola TaxID=2913560 RepID=UPI001F5A766E|nr:histidine kinase [Aestuariivivens sediminicola]
MSRSFKNIILVFIIGCAVFVVGHIFSGGFHFESTNEFLIDFTFYQLYSFVLGYSNMYFFDYLNGLHWKPNSLVKRILAGVIGSTLLTLMGLFFLRALTSVIFNGQSLTAFIANETWRSYTFGFWITLSIVAIFHLIYFYNKYQQNRIKEQKVIAGTASAKFDALKNQLDPHFLFNSLNVLTSLIDENPEMAQKFTTSLSKVYRYVLEQRDKELVTVDEELQFAKTYMSLLKMRFEDSIVFSMPEQASNPESKVVPLSLQLLLENAVKHNTVNSSSPLHIKIYEDKGALIVENNLQPKQILKKSSGVGLTNIKQRYNLLTDRKVNIYKETDRFAVALPILTKQVSIMRTSSHTNLDDTYVRARNYVEELKHLYYNIISYCLVIPFLIFINYQTSWDFKWFWFPIFGWAIGIGIQAFRLFINNGAYGRDWEKRKIEQFMREEENKWR